MKVLTLLQKLRRDDFLSGTAFLFAGSMLANVFAFLFNLFLARKLTTIDYGIYASLISFFSIAILLPQSFLLTIVQFATKYFSENHKEQAKKLYQDTTRILMSCSVILFIVLLAFSPFIQRYLHIENIWLIISVGLLIGISFLYSFNMSYLQSLLLFGYMSFLQALGAFAKLLSGIVFVFMGFGVLGAMGGVALSLFIPLIFSIFRLRFLLTPIQKKVTINVKEIYQYAFPTMLCAISLASFIASDVILAKHYLTPTQAGLYAGLSLIAKAIFYFTGIIPTVMFPVLVNKFAKGTGIQTTFYSSLILVGVPSLLISLVYFIFPKFIIFLFLGGRAYTAGATVLGFMALFISFYSIVSILVNFFLSVKQTAIAFPVVTAAVLQILFISFFHESLSQIIFVSLVVMLSLTIVLLAYYFYHHVVAKTYLPAIPQEI